MNKIYQVVLMISLFLLAFFGFVSLQTKVTLLKMEESIPFHAEEKKNSIGEGEFNKNRLQWKKRDNDLFQRIMSSSASRNEILLLREYKLLLEEILTYWEELNQIEPPVTHKSIHQELIMLQQNAYQMCLYYSKDYQKSLLYFRRYVTTFYHLYPPVTTER